MNKKTTWKKKRKMKKAKHDKIIKKSYEERWTNNRYDKNNMQEGIEGEMRVGRNSSNNSKVIAH